MLTALLITRQTSTQVVERAAFYPREVCRTRNRQTTPPSTRAAGWRRRGHRTARRTGRIIREASFVVRIVADDPADTHVRFTAIRHAYRAR